MDLEDGGRSQLAALVENGESRPHQVDEYMELKCSRANAFIARDWDDIMQNIVPCSRQMGIK